MDIDPDLQTSWEPLKGGGSNFKTHGLKLESPQRLVSHATSGALAFGGFFVLAGLLVGAAALGNSVWIGTIFLVGFFGGAVYLLREFTRARVFDRSTGAFRDGRKWVCALSEISGVQLLAEEVSSSETSYTSWEINLILADSRRFNVLDHGDGESARADATVLARFLGVPLLTEPYATHAQSYEPILLESADLMEQSKPLRRASSRRSWFMIIFGSAQVLLGGFLAVTGVSQSREDRRELDVPVLSGPEISELRTGLPVLTEATLSAANGAVSGELVLACKEVYRDSGDDDGYWETIDRYLPEVSASVDNVTFQLQVSSCPSGQTVENPDATSADMRVYGAAPGALVSVLGRVTSEEPLTITAERYWLGTVARWKSHEESTAYVAALGGGSIIIFGLFLVTIGWRRKRASDLFLSD